MSVPRAAELVVGFPLVAMTGLCDDERAQRQIKSLETSSAHMSNLEQAQGQVLNDWDGSVIETTD